MTSGANEKDVGTASHRGEALERFRTVAMRNSTFGASSFGGPRVSN